VARLPGVIGEQLRGPAADVEQVVVGLQGQLVGDHGVQTPCQPRQQADPDAPEDSHRHTEEGGAQRRPPPARNG
jgi:hypothetical protein